MPGRKRTTTSPTPALRASKRQRIKPTRTPQTVTTAKRLPRQPKPPKVLKLTPEEIAEKERGELVAVIAAAKGEHQTQQEKAQGPLDRDTELYLQDPYTYRALGKAEPVEVSSDDMIVCLAENVLFRLPRPALVDIAQLFADMFAIPFPPGEDVDGRADDRPVVLHGLGAEGLRKAMEYQLSGRYHRTCHACVHELVFAHRTGAYDLYENTATVLINNYVILDPPWVSEPRRSRCEQNHSQPSQPYGISFGFGGHHCYDQKHCIKELASHSHPDDKPEPDKTSTIGDAFYPCLNDEAERKTWDWYGDHFNGPSEGLRLDTFTAIEVLITAFKLGIDVCFFPGAFAAIIQRGEFLQSPQAVAKLTIMDGGSPEAIADCVVAHRHRSEGGSTEELEDAATRLGKGTQLVLQLQRAIGLWKYCTRLKGEDTWGMLNTVIRTVWDAPTESSDGWIFICEKP